MGHYCWDKNRLFKWQYIIVCICSVEAVQNKQPPMDCSNCVNSNIRRWYELPTFGRFIYCLRLEKVSLFDGSERFTFFLQRAKLLNLLKNLFWKIHGFGSGNDFLFFACSEINLEVRVTRNDWKAETSWFRSIFHYLSRLLSFTP